MRKQIFVKQQLKVSDNDFDLKFKKKMSFQKISTKATEQKLPINCFLFFKFYTQS